MVHLLDVNVLLALAWPNHVHHQAAHAWFEANHEHGWATCPMTQAGFVRLSCQPAVTRLLVPVREAVEILASSTKSPHHQFWQQDTPLASLLPEMLSRIMGPRQLTGAVLVDLAIRRQAALATFDRHMSVLLPPGSPHASRLTFIPV
ncbi:MAG: TA system VapC family ribonuclease toxin [Bryobacteraceae bacterium]|jgi:toxin-antitoxin system PIN domain toxin